MKVGDTDLFGEVQRPRGESMLARKFIVPPFSVLSARDGAWQERKRQWIALGIKSELGRGQENLGMSHPATTATVDFYAQKRGIEAEFGRTITTQEARDEIEKRGNLIDSREGNRERMAVRNGAVRHDA